MDSEGGLVQRCIAGDQAAYKMLFERHVQVAVRTAYLILGDQQLAEDAAQEAFVRAFKTLHRLRAGVSFSTWLHGYLIWSARSQARQKFRWREILFSRSFDAERDVSEAIERNDSHSVLAAAVRTLPPGFRETLVLRFYLDLSEAQIAEVLGCRVGTVKSRLARALDSLRKSSTLAESVAS